MHTESLWPTTIDRLDVTLPTIAENLAFDEALLDVVEADCMAASIRFWQPTSICVVLGRSNNVATEVDVDQCAELDIPILRRASGGGTVVIGPGCLCYTLALPLQDVHRSLGISRVAKELMSQSAKGLAGFTSDVEVCGTSDLTSHGMKFSGNAQRWLKNSFVHHGTILIDFDLSLIDRCLRHPTREPEYRRSRRHSEFVMNLGVDADQVKNGLADAWNGKRVECPAAVFESAGRIASTRYQSSDWFMTPDRYRPLPQPPHSDA